MTISTGTKGDFFMSKYYNVYISVDPGITGGIAILDEEKMVVYNIPIKKIVVNKKKKNKYDIQEIVKLLKPYYGKNVLFVQELVGVMPGQGNLSGFNFGVSAGSTIGIAAALEFEIVEVRPSMWKKAYPKLISTCSKKIKSQIKRLKQNEKTLEDKSLKKANKKEIEKLGRQIKTEAKSAARRLVSKLYPNLKGDLKLKKDDGKAEAVLICLWAKNNYKEEK